MVWHFETLAGALCHGLTLASKKIEYPIKILIGLGTRLGLWSDFSQSLEVEREHRLHEAEEDSQHSVLVKIFVSDTFTYNCTP